MHVACLRRDRQAALPQGMILGRALSRRPGVIQHDRHIGVVLCQPQDLVHVPIPGADAGDQTRVVTPADAMAMGVNDMVMGRPITQADDPAAVVESILASLPGMADR